MSPGRARGPAAASGTVVEICDVVGAEHVVRDGDVLEACCTDWTGRFRGCTEMLVRPGSASEVAEVVRLCARDGVALTVQGGNTGLVGGSVPLHGECVLSLVRLDEIGAVEAMSGQVAAGAGATLARVQSVAHEAGWSYPVDFSSRGSATIGGNIATNAGGYRSVRHGSTRHQIIGVEAVLGNGVTVSHLGGLPKEVTGYDLVGLLCGSEGTLGVVTAARLRLVPPTPEVTVALVAFAHVEAAVASAYEIRRTLPPVEAIEFLSEKEMVLVRQRFGLSAPCARGGGAYLLVEAADTVDPSDRLADTVHSCRGVVDAAVASGSVRRAELWQYRDLVSEAISALGVPHKFDVSIPHPELAEFVAEAGATVRSVAPTAEVWAFGHVAEGNLHVNVTGIDPGDERVDDAVLDLVARIGGSISAEHGIGTAKRRWLRLSRTADEIATFRALKATLDPSGILNPNVLLP